jgi:hypothetical protein
MKEVEKKDAPEVSGGYSLIDGPCYPPEWPWPTEYPKEPAGPEPEPDPVFQG